jgi:hypothetical protein
MDHWLKQTIRSVLLASLSTGTLAACYPPWKIMLPLRAQPDIDLARSKNELPKEICEKLWASRRLGAPSLRWIEAAREEAFASLRVAADTPVPPELHQIAGIPEPPAHRRLLEATHHLLWSRTAA